MRQNCKKSLLIAILIAFIGFLLVLSFLEDMNSSPNDPNKSPQVHIFCVFPQNSHFFLYFLCLFLKKSDSHEETLEKSTVSFKNLYINNSSLDLLLFPLRKFSFVGKWSSSPHVNLRFSHKFFIFSCYFAANP